MLNQICPPIPLAALMRLAAVFALGLLGCAPGEPSPPPLPAVSLLLVTPYIGEETELRDPPPQPTKLVLAEESVAGWLAPPERILRFPVELREGARLSFRLGVVARIPLRVGDLIMRVEYAPESPTKSGGADTPTKTALFVTTSEQSVQCFQNWLDMDIPLESHAPGRGELRFIVEGPMAGQRRINLLWGQPAIYHPNERRHRNVLLIGVDTLRADALTPYGAAPEVTPNLQAFSETATLFTQARAQSPWTLPSFASMITGGLPSIIGATIYAGCLPERATTLGEILLPLGYATGTICGNTYLGNSQSGFHQGMEGLWFRFNATPQTSVDRAREFIDRSMGRDWFCFLHFMDPHAPYDPPERFADLLCDPNYRGAYGTAFEDTLEWQSLTSPPPEAEVRQVRSLYNAEVADVDAALRELFAFMQQNGLIEETLIIFASDHGEEFFEHGGFEHGHTQYDEQVLMPLIVKGSGFPRGERIDTCVGNTDIVPTILRYLDLPIPDGLEGVPLQEVVAGNVGSDRAGAPAFQPARIIFGEGNNRSTHRKFAVEWPYKCIVDFVTGETRLYDLVADPAEMEDISKSNPDITTRLSYEIIAAMLPVQSAFHIWVIGSNYETPHRFTGTIRVPGGIERVEAFSLAEDDEYTVEGDTVTFAITSAVLEMGLDKHLTITPSPGADTLEATVLVDGRVEGDRFFPYGTLTPEPSGSATVRTDDFPLGADMSVAMKQMPSACYIWGVRGFGHGVQRAELSAEAREQLRALGYIN